MASFGANFPCFKPSNATKGVVMGKLVSANLTVNNASGELWADDHMAERVDEFANGAVAMETDNMEDSVASAIYDAKVEDGVVTYNKDDNPPEGILGYYKTLMVGGKKKYRAIIYPRAKAAVGNDNAQTRGSSITFNTEQTTFNIYADENGDWRKIQTFATETEAKTYVKTECAVS